MYPDYHRVEAELGLIASLTERFIDGGKISDRDKLRYYKARCSFYNRVYSAYPGRDRWSKRLFRKYKSSEKQLEELRKTLPRRTQQLLSKTSNFFTF